MNDRPNSLNLDEWIAAALLNELTPEEREAFDHYLTENPDALALYHQTTSMTHLLESTLAGVRPSPNFENRMIHAFREQSGNRITTLFTLLLEMLQRLLRLPYIYIPATAAILIGLVQLGSEITRPMESGIFNGTGTFNGKIRLLASDKNDTSFINYGSPIGATAAPAQVADTQSPTFRQKAERNEEQDNLLKSDKSDNSRLADAKRGYNTYSGGTTLSGGELEIQARLGPSSSVNAPAAKPITVNTASSVVLANNGQFKSPPSIPSTAPSSSAHPVTSPPAQTQQPVTDPGVVDNRKLVRNASLDLEVKNYDAALDSIASIAAGNSGYVATKNSSRLPNGKMSGTVVIKVLPERLDAALLQIRELGELKNQSLSTRDVTKEYFDTDARLRNSRKMEERLLALLDTMKGKITELLAVEKELARVREEIETMQGDLKVYDSLVQYATITISLREKDLSEAAAYLLKESVTLSLFSSDVEKTYESARHEADTEKAQIVQSRLERDDSGHATAFLTLLIAPDDADGLIAQIKGLGRVQNFNKEMERVAQDGSGNSTTAKVERDKVQLNLTIHPDDESRKQVALTVITKQVESSFETAKSMAATQGGEIVTSDLQHSNDGGSTGMISVRVPAKNYTVLLDSFKKAGIVSQFAIQRDEGNTVDGEKAPVMIVFTLTDADQPVQFTQTSILTPDVETQATKIKKMAAAPESQVEVKSSSFERTPDGQQRAMLAFRLPLAKYQSFLEQIESLGKVKELTIRRQDRTDTASSDLATAEITLQLYSQGNVVAEDNGLLSTLRKTLGEGIAALMWSVRMIGVAVAFLAPWGLALTFLIWIARRISKRKGKTSEKPPTD